MSECIACNNRKIDLYGILSGYTLLICRSCGLLFVEVDPIRRLKEVRKLYTDKYIKSHKANLYRHNKKYEMTLSRIEKYVKQGRLLDIGCGSGHFLKYVKEKKNRWICYGVEPNEKLLKYASSHNGIEVKKGFITKIPYPDEYFDVITCNDVLEHSIELNRNIIEIRRVLKKNGIILIQSPNFQSLMRIITGNKWDWWSIPDHVLHFSPEFLNSYLIKNGFKVLEKYTYEDSYDYLSNIYGLFSKQYLKKIGVMLLTPLLIILERISWLINYGGLLVFVVRK